MSWMLDVFRQVGVLGLLLYFLFFRTFWKKEMSDVERNCLYVTGLSKDVSRHTLISEFGKFGAVKKVFLEPTKKFAKIYFSDLQSAEFAVAQLSNSVLNWHISFFSNSPNKKSPRGNMAYYGDDYEDEDFTENFEYCNIHGQPLTVLQADSGDLYVNLKDIRKTGFAIFRRDTFNAVLIDHRQIAKEFELHLLSEAKNYILKNRVAAIDEDQILRTIERCKNKLLGEDTNTSPGRSPGQASGNFTITSNAQQSKQEVSPFSTPQVMHNRPPKMLPNNFVPTQTQRNEKSKRFQKFDQQSSGGKMDNKYNGVNSSPNFKNDNDSSSSDSKPNFRKTSSGFDQRNQSQRSFKDQRSSVENIPKITFEQGNIYEVQISHKEKENIFWVQDKKYIKQLEEVMLEINEAVENLESISPLHGQLVAAEYEGAWNRGRVKNVEPLIVHFLDYGNRSAADSVKALPDSLKTVPALAVRIAVNVEKTFEEDVDMKIKIKRQYEDGTYLVDVLNGSDRGTDNEVTSKSFTNRLNRSKNNEDDVMESSNKQKAITPKQNVSPPKQKLYFNIPKPIADLQNGDKVMLVDAEENKLLVRTRECANHSKIITEYIKNLDKSVLVLTSVKVGQLVLCSKDGFAGLFRAVVIKKESELIVSVKYVDFAGEAELSIKSLRNVDEYLANEPASILLTPVYRILEELDEKGAEYILQLCQNKQKLTVVLDNKNKFDLQTEDGTLLSETLHNLKSPKSVSGSPALSKPVENKAVTEKAVQASTTPVKNKAVTEKVILPEPKTDAKILYDEMDWVKIDPGSHELMCYCIQDIDDITFLSSSDEVINYLETVTCASPDDENPYKPELSEMCLVSYKGPEDDEPSWYRAVVLSVDGSDYTINFVDFGNLEVVQSKVIRKLPAHLKDIPVLGIGCSCTDIPNKKGVLERMKELMPEGTQVEVVIKGLDGLKYQIELPDIYKQLKSEKLF